MDIIKIPDNVVSLSPVEIKIMLAALTDYLAFIEDCHSQENEDQDELMSIILSINCMLTDLKNLKN